MYSGNHLLIDCRNVHRSACLDTKALLKAMPKIAESATAIIVLQVRYYSELYSTQSFMVMELLDVRQCSVYSYSSLDFFAPYISTIGGGIPCKYTQQFAPLYFITRDYFDISIEAPRVQYGIYTCPEPDSPVGLSGSTYPEGGSPGKFVFDHDGGMDTDVSADESFVMPLHVKAVFESHTHEQ